MVHMTLWRLRYLRVHSALLRSLLKRWYQPGRIYAIPFGPLRGVKLRYDPSINFHAMLGLWEPESFALLQRLLQHGKVQSIYDVGANIGLYALFFAQLLPPDTMIYAFEPAPAIVSRLRDHLEINHVGNAEIVEAACSNQNGMIDFYLGHHHHTSSLHAEWAAGVQTNAERITVSTVTLDDFIYGDTHLAPDFIKIDIEGGGTFALPGGARCFQQQRPLVLIESHTPDEDRAISNVLLAHDYQAFRLNDRQWVVERAAIHPQPQGVWGTLLLCPTERQRAVANVVNA